MAASAPLLEARGVSKSFGAVHALADVDFAVDTGEVVGLVGDNGAGKSTLIKAISGIQPADTGEILFEGSPVAVTSPTDAVSLGVATVYQDLALCDNLDVVANLFLGREEVNGLALDEVGMEDQADELLSTLSTTIPSLRTEVGSLSGGQRQQVAIARSLLGQPKLVMLDEPTAALGVPQTKQVLALIRQLRDRGLGVIVISHNLENVFQVCDRIYVLRLGRKAGEFETAKTSHEEIVAAITGAAARAGGDGGHA